MKSFITPAYTFTPGASGVGTVNLSGISSFDIKRLVSIINQTRGAIIYATGSASLKYSSVSGSTVTLFVDTSAMSSADVLQVIYEDVVTAQPVSAASLPLPAGAATESTLAAQSAKLPATLGQKTMANALGVTIASDQSALPTDANAFLDISGSAGALNGDAIASTDVSKYKEISLAIAGTYSGILTFQGSNDNTNFFSVNATLTSTGTNVPTQFVSGSTGIYKVPVMFKYFRCRMTSYTSGTATAIALATSNPSTDLGMKSVSAIQSGTWNVGSSTPASVAGTVTSAQITVGTTAVRATVAGTAPNAARKLLLIKPSTANTGRIWIGPSTVTTANGLEVVGPDRVEFDFDAGDYYMVSDSAAQSVDVIEKV